MRLALLLLTAASAHAQIDAAVVVYPERGA